MLDAGAQRDFERVVREYLRRRGINRLDGLLVTHGDGGHVGGASAVLHDFVKLEMHGLAGTQSLGRQDKGHGAALETFFSSISKQEAFPIPWEQLYETTRATIELDRAAWGRLGAESVESLKR